MVGFRLNHYCNRKGSTGEPGDVVEITEEEAVFLEARGGGRRLDVETADEQAPAVAETADRPPKRGRRKPETAEDARPAEAEQADD